MIWRSSARTNSLGDRQQADSGGYHTKGLDDGRFSPFHSPLSVGCFSRGHPRRAERSHQARADRIGSASDGESGSRIRCRCGAATGGRLRSGVLRSQKTVVLSLESPVLDQDRSLHDSGDPLDTADSPRLIRWAKQAHSHAGYLPSDEDVRRLQWWLRAEGAVLLATPFVAAAMAPGRRAFVTS